MDARLLEQLSAISPEERRILEGNCQIDRSIYMPEDSDEIDQSRLLEKGKIIALRPHTRFVHFPKHTHNYIEMIYMCQGKTRHKIDGNELTLEQGEILLLSQNAVQEVMPAGEEDVAVNLIIWPQFFDTTLQILGEEENPIRDLLVDCLRNQNKGTGYLHFKVADILPIQNLMENILWTLMNTNINKRSISQWSMGLLFLNLVNHTDTLQTDPHYSNQKLMIQVLRYIEGHYCDGSLREIAEEMHYELSWLSREIKKLSGMTFTELVQNKRMSQAIFLLKTTKMNVTEISERVGYENLSYFHRIFKKRYGMTPHQYRNCK